jgi:hypothetical protein
MLRGLGETRGARLYEEIIRHGRNLSITSRPLRKLLEIKSVHLLMGFGTTSNNFIFYLDVSCLPLPNKESRKKLWSKLKKGLQFLFVAMEEILIFLHITSPLVSDRCHKVWHTCNAIFPVYVTNRHWTFLITARDYLMKLRKYVPCMVHLHISLRAITLHPPPPPQHIHTLIFPFSRQVILFALTLAVITV